MKKISLLLLAFVACAFPAYGQVTWSFTLDAGYLTGPGGTAINLTSNPTPLLLLVDVGSSNALPTVTAGTINNGTLAGAAGGIILAQLTFNTNGSGNPSDPETFNSQTNVTLPSTVNAGDHIVLEWFPTVSSSATTLISGEAYGAVNPVGTSVSTDGGQIWEVASNVNLDYNTVSDGKDEPNISGQANNIVVAAAPEPATYALLLFALPLIAWSYRRQAKLAAVLARS